MSFYERYEVQDAWSRCSIRVLADSYAEVKHLRLDPNHPPLPFRARDCCQPPVVEGVSRW